MLVARHGLTLDDSTDVASRPDFAARRRTQVHAECCLAAFKSRQHAIEQVRTGDRTGSGLGLGIGIIFTVRAGASMCVRP